MESLSGSGANRPLKVCLVRPPTITNVGAVGQDAVPPLGLAYIAAALSAAGHAVSAVDMVGEAVDQYSAVEGLPNALMHGLTAEQAVRMIPPDTEVLGVSSMFSVDWPYTKLLLRELRKAFPTSLIVAGGEHVTACPEHVLSACPELDAVVLGEGEQTITDLLDAHGRGGSLASVKGIARRNHGRAAATAARPRLTDLDAIPDPLWEAFPVRNYIDNNLTHGANLGRCMPILASRGCPFRCAFCSSPAMWTTTWKARSVGRVVAEMKEHIARYGVTNFDFYDLTAIIERKWILEFCSRLREEKLNITWQLPSGTRCEAIDAEVSRAMHAAGCRILNYAPESGSPAELKRIKKQVNLGKMLLSIRGAHHAGLKIKVNFVFAIPGSGWGDIGRTLLFLVAVAWNGADDANCFPFSPYPGSEIFRDMERAGRIKMDERYFTSLLAYTDPANSVSFVDHISSRQLSFLNFFGMILFYSCSFLFWPPRFFRLAWAILSKDSSTKLTMALANQRRKKKALERLRREGTNSVIVLD